MKATDAAVAQDNKSLASWPSMFKPHTIGGHTVTCALFVQHDSAPTTYPKGVSIPPHRRVTVAVLVQPSGAAYVGVSVCNPWDQFVRKIGRLRAVGRALSAAQKQDGDTAVSVGSIKDVRRLLYTTANAAHAQFKHDDR